MDASINTAKVALKQEIARLTGILGHMTATLLHLDSLTQAIEPTSVPTSVTAPTVNDNLAAASPASVAEMVTLPVPPAPSKPAASKLYTSAVPVPASPEASRQLHLDVDAWMPKLTRIPLADLYLVATLDRPKHLPQLPSSLDLENTEALRVMGNYLRHSEVQGYRDFCARLKAFTGLSHLYKRVRDKATAAINTAYPELAGGTFEFPVNNQKPAPSGAVQFAVLANLLALPAPVATA